MVHEVLYDFESMPASPDRYLLPHANGAFYGVSKLGGPSGYGTVYRLGADGSVKVLAWFDNGTGARRGRSPSGGLCLGPDGALYGCTLFGGANDAGVFFRCTLTGELSILHDFTALEGSEGYGPLLLHNGDFFGTRTGGGADGKGTVIKLSPDGTCTVLMYFRGQVDDGEGGGPRHDEPEKRGQYPRCGLVLAGDGKLYGTTETGGEHGSGTIFRLLPDGTGIQTVADFSYLGAMRGSNPESGLTVDGDWLYGATHYGGLHYGGTAYRISTAGVFETLIDFNPSVHVGTRPFGVPCKAADGNFYLITSQSSTTGQGAILRMTAAGQVSLVRELTGLPGPSYPKSTLVQGADGHLYGASDNGGWQGPGCLFEIDPVSGDLDVISIFARLHAPGGEMVQDADGTLWGCTIGDHGGVFRFGADGSFRSIHAFSGTDGSVPYGGLVWGQDGCLYGTTSSGGSTAMGTIFKVTPEGDFSTVFTPPDGNQPGNFYGTLTRTPDGKLYGTSFIGGAYGQGTLFRLETDGSVTIIASFQSSVGANPRASPVLGPDGDFYGTTSNGGSYGNGTIYKASLTGQITVIRHLYYYDSGYAAEDRLAFGDQPEFFGVTRDAYNGGRLFIGTDTGNWGLLYVFSSYGLFQNPSSGVTKGLDGNIYGTASSGGTFGNGGIYRYEMGVGFQALVNFTGTEGEHRGANSYFNHLIVGVDGHFYGATYQGGLAGLGTLYRLRATDPKIMVKNGSGVELAEGAQIDMGPAVVGEFAEQKIILRNTGGLPLKDLEFEFTGDGALWLSVVNPPTAPLLPRTDLEVVLRFTAGAVGPWTAQLAIGSNDPENPEFLLNLFGDGAGDPAKVYRQPKSVLARTGSNVQFDVVVAGDPAPTTVWQKNGKNIPGAKGTQLLLNGLKTTDAGLYTAVTSNAPGQKDPSQPARLGVLLRAPNTLQVARGKSITLTCTATMPKGVTPLYQWVRNNMDMPGKNGPLLLISNADPSTDQTSYTCRVTMPSADGDLVTTHGNTWLWVVDPPTIQTTTMSDYNVGQSVNYWLSASQQPLRWTAKGLPPGVKLNAVTGQFIGRPTAPRLLNGVVVPYYIQLTATNAAGVSRTVVVAWKINPLPWTMIGDYSGLVGLTDHAISERLGGLFNVKVSSTGSVSGSLALARRTIRFTGMLDWDSKSMTVQVNAGGTTGSLPLHLSFNSIYGNAWISADLGSGGTYHQCLAYRKPWVNGNLATAYEAWYNIRLHPAAAILSGQVSAAPHGDGFLRLNLTAAGAANYAGKLADGTALTGSGILDSQSRVPVYKMLYDKTGCVHGTLSFSAWGSNTTGSVQWLKKAQNPVSKTRSYAGGFAMLGGDALEARGGRYVKPPFTGQPMLLPGMVDGPNNVTIAFGSGGFSGAHRAFQVTAAHQVILPTQSPEDRITFTVNAATGQFSGKMTREDDDPSDTNTPPRKIRREAAYEGLIVPGYDGVGFFNLPQLPDSMANPPTTMSTSPFYSGWVTLKPTDN